MKILFAIPHYFNPNGSGKYGSTRKNPVPRIYGLSSCIASIHSLFAKRQYFLDISSVSASPLASFSESKVDIIILTHQHNHVLNKLSVSRNFYSHREVKITSPEMLGFEAKKVFAENAGEYDYYCYIEDDLIIGDPWFFNKLKWFNSFAADEYLLQPHRCEVSTGEIANKVYIDGNLRVQATDRFQDINDSPSFQGVVMGEKVSFNRTLNPHSGCYFLNKKQLEIWMDKPYFNEDDTSFVGPLESAATLGIMKTFKVYKPVPANFLEIRHFGTSFLSLLGGSVNISERVPERATERFMDRAEKP